MLLYHNLFVPTCNDAYLTIAALDIIYFIYSQIGLPKLCYFTIITIDVRIRLSLFEGNQKLMIENIGWKEFIRKLLSNKIEGIAKLPSLRKDRSQGFGYQNW